ncbi:MAG: hypothetical protein WKG07_03985 [Hymenobacter sp.]
MTQTATLAAGQGVFLDLKYAHSIRVRPGAGLKRGGQGEYQR